MVIYKLVLIKLKNLIEIVFFKELLFTLEGFKNTAWFLSCYQFFIYGFLSFTQMGFAGISQRRFLDYQKFFLYQNLLIFLELVTKLI